MYQSLAINDRPRYEKYNWYFERVMWFLFLLILLTAMAGVFGSGYFSKAHIGDEHSPLQISYSRFLREEADSQILFEITPAKSDSFVSLRMDSHILKVLRINQIMPEPDEVFFTEDQFVLTYAIKQPVQVMRITLQIHPIQWGRIQWKTGVVSGTTYEINQFTYP